MKDISFKQLLVLMVITFVVGLLVLDFFGGGDLFGIDVREVATPQQHLMMLRKHTQPAENLKPINMDGR